MQAAGSTVPGTSDRLKDRTGTSEHLAFLDRGKAVHRTRHGNGGMEAASLLRVRRGLTSWASALVQRSTGSMAENHTSTVSKNVSKGARTVLVRVGAV